MRYKIKINDGFTLIELLISILIMSSVFITVLWVFTQLDKNLNVEYGKNYVIDYANRGLDALSEEIMKAQSVDDRRLLGTTTLQLRYPNNEEIGRFKINDKGFYKVIQGKDSSLVWVTEKEFNRRNYNYTISYFYIDDDLPFQTGVNLLSRDARLAREASYALTLRIDVLDDNDEKIE